MRSASAPRVWFLFVALAACSSTSGGSGDASAPIDASTGDSTATDVAATDTPTADVIATDATATDAPVADVAASDGPLLPPLDSGTLLDDAGALGEPPWAPLDVRTTTSCPPLVACGGAEVGTWDVSGGCIDVPVPSQLMSCPGARVSRSVGRARGRVTFASGFARRAAQWEVEVELVVPMLCASFVGGCSGLQGILRGAIPDSACATEGNGDCRCAARQSGAIRDADGYTTMNNQIVSAVLGKRWDYCVDGARLRYRDATPTGAREPGTIELTRRAP